MFKRWQDVLVLLLALTLAALMVAIVWSPVVVTAKILLFLVGAVLLIAAIAVLQAGGFKGLRKHFTAAKDG